MMGEVKSFPFWFVDYHGTCLMKKHSFTTEYLITKATKTDIHQCFIDMGLIVPPQDIFYLFNSKNWSAYSLMHLYHILFRTATGQKLYSCWDTKFHIQGCKQAIL